MPYSTREIVISHIQKGKSAELSIDTSNLPTTEENQESLDKIHELAQDSKNNPLNFIEAFGLELAKSRDEFLDKIDTDKNSEKRKKYQDLIDNDVVPVFEEMKKNYLSAVNENKGYSAELNEAVKGVSSVLKAVDKVVERCEKDEKGKCSDAEKVLKLFILVGVIALAVHFGPAPILIMPLIAAGAKLYQQTLDKKIIDISKDFVNSISSFFKDKNYRHETIEKVHDLVNAVSPDTASLLKIKEHKPQIDEVAEKVTAIASFLSSKIYGDPKDRKEPEAKDTLKLKDKLMQLIPAMKLAKEIKKPESNALNVDKDLDVISNIVKEIAKNNNNLSDSLSEGIKNISLQTSGKTILSTILENETNVADSAQNAAILLDKKSVLEQALNRFFDGRLATNKSKADEILLKRAKESCGLYLDIQYKEPVRKYIEIIKKMPKEETQAKNINTSIIDKLAKFLGKGQNQGLQLG